MYHVLICDDDRDIVAAMRIYLETEGYGVFASYTGQETLRILRE